MNHMPSKMSVLHVMNNRTSVPILHIVAPHTHKQRTSTAAYATDYTTPSLTLQDSTKHVRLILGQYISRIT